MTSPTATEPRTRVAPLARLAGLTAALAAILIALLALFILPSLKSGAHDLPLGIAGDPLAVAQVETALKSAAPGEYAVEHFSSAGALDAAIANRTVHGGLVAGPNGLEVHVASAGSTAISGSLTATAQVVGQATARPVAVSDVVPLAWSALIAEAAHVPVERGTELPAAWRDLVDGMELDAAHTLGTGEAPFRSWREGYDPADALDRAVQATRRAVFPLWGLDPHLD